MFSFVEEVDNAKRASWAQSVLTEYATAHRTENDQQSLADLLNNILHLASRRKDLDFVAALILAKCHFRDEYIEEASSPQMLP